MKFKRFLIAPPLAAVLLFATGGMYSASVVHASHSVQEEQPRYLYVCPMHADVTSKKPGKCPKCKMKLEKKRIKAPVAKPPDR